MFIKFDKEYLAELYYNGKCNDKKHRYQPQVVKNYVKRIMTNLGYPYMPIHPGEILREELESRGLSHKHFAETSGIPYAQVIGVLKSHKPVTTDFALQVEAITGIRAEMLVSIQSQYDMQVARTRKTTHRHSFVSNFSRAAAIL
jgi:addiction module HigA family antidote